MFSLSTVWLLSTGFIATIAALYYFSRHQGKQQQYRQQQGLQANAALLNTMQLIQQHRSLSSREESGKPALQRQIQQTREAIDHNIACIDADFSSAISFFNSAVWHAFTADWQSLSNHWQVLTTLDNINSHCLLIKTLLEAIPLVSIDSQLDCTTADNRLYHLLRSAPLLVEKIGQFRALCSATISDAELPSDELTQQVIKLGLAINKELIDLNSSLDMPASCHQPIADITQTISAPRTENNTPALAVDDLYEKTSVVTDALVDNIRHRLIKAGRENITG
ncbi:hypothetical protein SIN8267_00181 [Sinobacterium norvegicum]|uniref:Nitrate/nitrite sensing protein domain-containing protein n=1 Tax=Sinobacterium norvegicum TaxID=1641715 RepID=A0ABM9ABW9_9GAMM|nr:hypothetical protein [Sinobacterium norvegicum]CAH0990098.1 hypothetical protein SIN8267_00181 [Sinobacterium norvegicum]